MRTCRAGFYILLILLLGLPVMLCAQDDDSQDDLWDDFAYDAFVKGDRTFTISLGIVFPTVFVNQGEIKYHQIDPPVGGTGSLGINYFFNPRFFIGGEVAGMFLPTLGGNILYVIPLGFRVGTQFILGRFEFPINAVIGMVWRTYMDLGHYGFYLKASASALFRATNDWAFGLTSSWYYFPEWTSKKSEDVFGNIVDLTLIARYQF